VEGSGVALLEELPHPARVVTVTSSRTATVRRMGVVALLEG
jgi:hypothetical protein